MESRAWLAVIVAALAFGALGYYYGKSDLPEEPYAAQATVVAQQQGAPTCMASAAVVYDPNATQRLSVSPQPIEVNYPPSSDDPKKWAICWTLVVKPGGDPTTNPGPDPFAEIRLDKLQDLLGQGGSSVLKGDTNLKGKQWADVFFNDEPVWLFDPDGNSYVDIKYDVIARLKDGTNLDLDPDVVIIKPKG